MLSPKSPVVSTEGSTAPSSKGHYVELTTLNRGGLISKSINKQILQGIASEYLDLLETSSAIYEKNGDYALKLFSSSWGGMMDSASRGLCNTADNAAALASDTWLCHESCWTNASEQAIETQAPVDIVCNGGIRLYAIPILANGEAIGAISFAYGDPPRDQAKLQAFADSYNVEYEQLLQAANTYDSRPPFIIELAKKRLQMSARLISLLVERKITEETISLSEARHRTLINTIPDLVWSG
jgi:ligand-binding sensor protein